MLSYINLEKHFREINLLNILFCKWREGNDFVEINHVAIL